MHKQRGFTLVELLVVIAIIALLMSILMPALGRTKQQALAVACLSRLHQWGLVFSLYTGKNNGFFHARETATTEAYKKIWIYTYKPYYNDPKMRYCPAAAKDTRVGGTFGVWDYEAMGSWRPDLDEELWVEGENEIPYGSYGLPRPVWNMPGSGYWKRSDIKGGDRVPLLLDSMYACIWFHDNDAEPLPYDGYWLANNQSASCINRHLGHVNVLFMDFSVRKVGLKEIWTLKGNPGYDTCGPRTMCDNGGDPAPGWPAWLKPFKDY